MNLICFADTRFPIERANGVQTMATCHALALRGHHVSLVTRPDTTSPARDAFEFYGVSTTSNLQIEAIATPRSPRLRRAMYLLGALRMAASSGADVVFTRDLGLASFLLQIPATHRPPVAYESHGMAMTVSQEMPRLLGQAQLTPSAAKLRRLDRRERRVWRKSAAYVTITQALADELAKTYGPRAQVFVVPDGARPLGSGARPLSTLSNQASHPFPVAAYAGHLYPWKGVDVFVHALALAPNLAGLIVGGHPGEADLARVQALARDVGVTDRLTITGLVPPGDVIRHLAGADVLVLPNTPSAISERYTSPLKLFEYLTLGRPIVASDLPSIREILTHDRNALLVPAGDATALAAALTRVTTDPALAARLGASAAALSADYTWDRRAERLETALTAAISA